MGEETGSPPARAGFWKDDQGHRVGLALLLLRRDTSHDRLAVSQCSPTRELKFFFASARQSRA